MKLERFIRAALAALLCTTACTKEEGESPLPPAPVITLDSPTSIYTAKTGRPIEIRPTVEHADGATFAWSLDGELLGDGPTLRFVSDRTGRYYITLTVANAGGEASAELRIDVVELAPPRLTLPGADEGFTLLCGSELVLEPTVSTPLETLWSWRVDGTEVSTGPTYTFVGERPGDYIVEVTAHNEDGEGRLACTVAVRDASEVDFAWHFAQDTCRVALGRTVLLRPLDIENAFDAEYVWRVDGTEVQRGERPEYHFAATEEGFRSLRIEMHNSYLVASRELTVHVCPPEGSYYRAGSPASRAECNRVYEYLPAPGQFINEEGEVTTPAGACILAGERLASGRGISLGGFGGYVVVGFDHSVDNSGGYDLLIEGNAFEGSSEPGVVWVMQDENGDGLPNDTWYELRSSEYGKPETDPDYAVTYIRPDTPGSPVPWYDNRGGSGTIDHLGAFHPQDYYYPAWVETDRYTLRGTRLHSRSYDQSGDGTYWVNPSFDWGYADNFSTIDRPADGGAAGGSANCFRIADAVAFDGSDAKLRYVDFVKVQTALNQQCGWIGEVSTELFGIRDHNIGGER